MSLPNPPIVFETLLERCMNDGEFLREMLGLFKQQMSQHFATLAEKHSAGDVEGVRKVTHAMKGSAANLSAGTLSALCAAAEQDAKSGQLPSAESIAVIRAEYDRVTAYYPMIESRLR